MDMIEKEYLLPTLATGWLPKYSQQGTAPPGTPQQVFQGPWAAIFRARNFKKGYFQRNMENNEV